MDTCTNLCKVFCAKNTRLTTYMQSVFFTSVLPHHSDQLHICPVFEKIQLANNLALGKQVNIMQSMETYRDYQHFWVQNALEVYSFNQNNVLGICVISWCVIP
jgi:hypothetical protein